MVSGWDTAAVIGPLALGFIAMIVSASPVALAFFHRSSRRIVAYIWPARGRCCRVLWSDIPAGRIHTCYTACQHVNPQAFSLHDPTNCWDDSVGKVFNQLWSLFDKSPSTSKNTIKKPYQLHLFRDYIKTDAQILKAFLILTTNICRTCEAVKLKTSLEIETFGEVVTVHLKAPALAPTNPTFTKLDLERIMDGNPPFYRSSVITTGGIQLKHPIRKNDQVGHGAWILAVGMTLDNGHIPTLYNMQQVNEEKMEVYWRGTLVMSAFKMIERTLDQLRRFEELRHNSSHCHVEAQLDCIDSWSQHALSCYQVMMDPEYSTQPWDVKRKKMEDSLLFEPLVGDCQCIYSCLNDKSHAATCRRFQHDKKDPASSLTKEQCEAAFEIFDNERASKDKLEIIFPVLLQVLQTVIIGMCEVEHYFSHTGQKLDFPEILDGKRHIYLRKCIADDD